MEKYRTQKANSLWLVIHNKIRYVQHRMAASGREFIVTENMKRLRKMPKSIGFLRMYFACVFVPREAIQL